jgi:MerR family mercuric resistance operon transcriptional regulator
MNTESTQTLTTGRLARRAGVGIDTVRFYERRGLLPAPARTPAGYRVYGTSAVERIRFIRRAKLLGFSLDEISALLALQDHGGRKSAVKDLARRKIDEIETRIEDLSRMRDVLRSLEADCTGRGEIAGCPIIDALAGEETA